MIAEPGRNHVAAQNEPNPSPNSFGVAEVCLLILATVLGGVADWALRSRGVSPTLGDLVAIREPLSWGRTLAVGLVPLGLAWTLATLATLDGAVRPVGSLARRPGLTAALAVGPAVLVAAFLVWSRFDRRVGWVPYLALARFTVVDAMAAGVAFGWMVLVRTRRWEPASTWADRVGLGLGGYWILAAILVHAAR